MLASLLPKPAHLREDQSNLLQDGRIRAHNQRLPVDCKRSSGGGPIVTDGLPNRVRETLHLLLACPWRNLSRAYEAIWVTEQVAGRESLGYVRPGGAPRCERREPCQEGLESRGF